MSSVRPGTVDYSKWDDLDVSSSEDEANDDKDGGLSRKDKGMDEEEEDYYDEEGEYYDEEKDYYESEESSGEEEEPANELSTTRRVPATPAASLATLQRAWEVKEDANGNATPTAAVGTTTNADAAASANTNDTTTANKKARQCAACSKEGGPLFRCSRCRMVWFCNRQCQLAYHPVHKTECIDAKQHFQYWGFLNSTNSAKKRKSATEEEEENDKDNSSYELTPQQRRLALQNALEARIQLRRRRALKKAAAAAAVERARLARQARGHVHKGGGKGKEAAEKEETCAVCQCEFTVAGDGGAGLCCPSSHFMCNECAGVYCNSVLADLHTSYPPKCPMCRALLPLHPFEAQLTPAQLALVKAHAAEIALKPNQQLAKCKECAHFEIETSPGSVVWWCAACGHGSCFVCHQDLPRNVVKYDLAKSPHAICAALRHVKSKVERAIEEGSQMACPGCGLKGRKDDACTHMNCPKCATEWCYVCGLSVVDCDKAPPGPGRPVNDIYLHNREWEVNDKRCPMYLTQILEVDLSWLGENWENINQDDFEDDEKCLDHFHRFRTIQKLQKAREEVGAADFEAVFANFDSIRNAGYSLEEVIETSTEQLIDREDFIRHQAEEHRREAAAEGIGEEEEEEFEAVPEEMTRATIQEEEEMRQAMEASHQDTMEEAEGDKEEDEEEAFEQVPEEMTRAVVQEENNMQRAVQASRVSAQEDDMVRRVLAESMSED